MKLKASELRVGNIIYDKWDKIERKVNPVDILNQENGALYKAVELTEDWLVKLGFEKEEDHIFLFPNNSSLRMWGFAWTLQQWNLIGGWCDVIAPSIKYVHQLQNLYFALTGKEL